MILAPRSNHKPEAVMTIEHNSPAIFATFYAVEMDIF
jgi:hypothetical protein